MPRSGLAGVVVDLGRELQSGQAVVRLAEVVRSQNALACLS
jgi:hypothetical protein